MKLPSNFWAQFQQLTAVVPPCPCPATSLPFLPPSHNPLHTSPYSYILTLASSTASAIGFDVIYRDTDSVFLVKRLRHYVTVSHYLNTLHCILDNMPFHSVRLELEKTYLSLISVKPKMYYGLVRSKGGDTKREIKGLASVRKDRPRIAQSLVNGICEHMFVRY